jgi:uncharacterized membrane protein YbhN (UPF0104 family)
VLDVLTVLVLLASSVFVFDRGVGTANPTAFAAMKWAGATALGGSIVALVVMFVLAGDPGRIGRWMHRLEQAVPSTLAGLVGRVAEKFSRGLGAVRRPGRLFVALLWSFPLWLSIAAGLWAVSLAFRIAVPFTGTFLLIALLVIGVAVPTPGAIGGFHAVCQLALVSVFHIDRARTILPVIALHAVLYVPAALIGALCFLPWPVQLQRSEG